MSGINERIDSVSNGIKTLGNVARELNAEAGRLEEDNARLRSENDRLREASKDLIEYVDKYVTPPPWDPQSDFSLSEFERRKASARRALEGERDDG